jgi:hypothetical protein
MRHGWSTERQTWRQVGEQAVGRNWKRVPFAALHQGLVTEQSGVYAICTPGLAANAGLFGVLYNAVYVGQSRDLRRRFLEHCRSPARELQSALNCFRVLEFWFAAASLEELDSLEQLLIECLGPPANQRVGITARLGPPQRI